MQYDRYEKLIVVDKGVELINWPETVPFVTASSIGSLQTLHQLLDALTHPEEEKRCRWVNLSQEAWAARKEAWKAAMLQAEPRKRKRKVMEPEESGSSSEEFK